MRTGYGRGYYGEGQLDPGARSRGSGWGKLVVVAAVGAGVWLLWPRSSPHGEGSGSGSGPGPDDKPKPSPPSSGGPSEVSVSQALPEGRTLHGVSSELDRFAQDRGYASRAEYENDVVASARKLRGAGATVELAPHLQHLSSRLEP